MWCSGPRDEILTVCSSTSEVYYLVYCAMGTSDTVAALTIPDVIIKQT